LRALENWKPGSDLVTESTRARIEMLCYLKKKMEMNKLMENNWRSVIKRTVWCTRFYNTMDLRW
jgi:hypothetical protein